MTYLPFNNIFSQLVSGRSVCLYLDGFNIALFIENNSKLVLQTPVYQGDHYIPQGVRQCIKQSSSIKTHLLKTSLVIEEELFQISLKYSDPAIQMNDQEFKLLLGEFVDLATSWRARLDERDRQDHIYIRVK